MAKTVAPLLSFSAGGKIANTQVYASWRGISYARRYVIPSNPRSANQTETRSVFQYLTQTWKLLSAAVQEPWTLFTTGKPLINRNAWIQQNLPSMRTPTTINTIKASPGAGGGPAMAGFTATGAAGEIDCAFMAPTLPSGWSIVQSVAIAWPEADPHVTTDFSNVSNVSTADPWSIALTVPSGDYVVSGFLKYLTANGGNAYSPSQTLTATAT